ncbi:uncharacterized protein LOC129882373 [Solanum dulcamara]|uniref:uncharacterized protein LOC129882373 n=1 Tax=Solanum dulcamara TaxID=45834 RepID=UPI002485CCE7|nr:uncharacterized protein LOC129882373 [Solanum dulcamara]
MDCLTGSSLKGVCLDKVLDKHKGLSLSKKSEICFLGLSSFKIVHISSCSVQNKTIHPISCASDTQIQAQSEETETTDTNQSEPVRVKFQLTKECSFGQHFYLVGDDPMLGSWDPSNAVPLDWSEGHVWSVELDISSGKTISYKFIMTVDDETILWQQGPDRILQTWETKNTITVSEDWDNAELQTIVEEEPGAEQSAVSPEILIDENLVPPSVVDLKDDVNEEKINEVLAIVAENITEVNEDVNTGRNEDTTMEAKVIGENDMAFNDELLSSKNESILVEDERIPVLVPGLTQVLTSDVHSDKVVAESSLGSNSEEFNVLLSEVHMDGVVTEGSVGLKSEEFNVTELSTNQEVATDTDITHPRETPEKVMLNVKQEVTRGNEDVEKSELVEGGGDWSNGKPIEENVFVSDKQWGKKTLLKFFASLGFCKVEVEG